ncbi:C-type mannose receptor 2-like [Salminus brasiliensis]|uniref:C-type mannose receptor 2-like n=1 Tax=Salminus brasiliensis TaxID=930266 RepID=UPI003B832AF2
MIICKNFWIGLGQKPKQITKNWIWSDGSNFTYRDWKSGEPNNKGSDNCVELLSKHVYKWNDAKCLNLNPFVCYKEIPLTLIKQNKMWREALRYCREKHVDLVSVHTEDIQHQVEFVTKGASTANVWMGLRHTCTLSFWFWVSGEFPCYQNWAPGNGTEEEGCSGGERTGAVQSGSKQWVSLPETQKLNFICSIISEENGRRSKVFN